MRSLLGCLVASGVIVACGGFGGEDAPAEVPGAGTPQDNAQPPEPPTDGKPIPGIYVSTSLGSDDGAGTLGRPVKTLAKAFALANEQHLRVLACAEVYEESLTLVDGVSAYGYYECAASPWKKGDRRAIVKSKTSPAVTAKGLVQPTRLEGFEVRGPDLDGTEATADSGSSIALSVLDAKQLIISKSLVVGGKGAHGKDGVPGPKNALGAGVTNGTSATPQMERICNGATCPTFVAKGPPGGTGACAIGDPGGPGGAGGDGRYYIEQVPNTVPAHFAGYPDVATPATAAGGIESNIGLPGNPGAPGQDGIDGVTGEAWSLTKKGFVPADGTAGTAGKPGQGGGGGAGVHDWYTPGVPPLIVNIPFTLHYSATATGAGGGAGGCAGQPGTPGTGGAASIGALIIDSAVTFDDTEVRSSLGGEGGLGVLGQPGTTGPDRGFGFAFVGGNFVSGSGGQGGFGGSGGASGHGGAGPSMAVAYAGTRPLQINGAFLHPGGGGNGKPMLTGKTLGGAPKTLPGSEAGKSFEEYEIK